MTASHLTRRQATRRIEGLSFPVLARSADYHLADLTVFEDGVLELWDVFDMAMFEDRVRRGRICVSVPKGEWMRIGTCGSIEVGDAQWAMTPEMLIERAYEVLARLNPSLRDLVDFEGSASEVIDNALRSKQDRSHSVPWHQPKDARGCEGRGLWAFERGASGIELVQVILFDPDCVTVTGQAGQRQITLAEIEAEATAGRFDFPQTRERVTIPGLGVVTCAYAAPGGSSGTGLIGDLHEYTRALSGAPTSYEVCRAAANAYWARPCLETLNALREAYEAVPSHLRMYCGDMDEKDIPIRIALYGEQEIEEWSHWQVARAMGLPLPVIDVPKPVDG